MYDPDVVALIVAALEAAWADVAEITLIAPSADQSTILSLMAARITAGIEEGIRDVSGLKTLALNAIDWYALVASDNPTSPRRI
jgi:hypothetical protein